MKTSFAVLCSAFISFAVFGETLVFAPDVGETTNVAVRLTGDTSVSANPGASGGGTVKISGRYNDYTGSTTNNCGYLWPSFFGVDMTYGSLGSTALLSLGAGTLKYTGPAGVFGAPVNHTGANTEYSVYEIGADSELTLTGKVTSVARLVKTGSGTLRLAYGGSDKIILGGGGNMIDGCCRLALNENGDAPTGKGGAAALSVVDGAVAIDSGEWEFKGTYPVCIGLYTVADTGTETKNQEPSGTLEINGGKVHFTGDINLGVHNGFTMNTPNGRTSSALVINDGDVEINSIWFGRSYYDPTKGLSMNSNPRVEIHGGNVWRSQNTTFKMGNCPGLLSELTFDGGKFSNTYFIPANNWCAGIITGEYKGDSSSTNIVTIGGTADVTFSRLQNSSDEVTFVRLNDDAVFNTAFIYNNAGFLSVDFNGGSLYQRFSSTLTLISNTVSRVTVGAKGGTIGATQSWYGPLALVQKGIEPLPGLVGTDGGITFASLDAASIVRLFGANTHYGPTTIGMGITELAGGGRLSPNAPLVLAGGTLVITNVAQTVAGLTVGVTATTTAETLKFTKTLPLTVTGAVKLKGAPTLAVVPLNADGTVCTTAGDYTVLTAPKAQKKMVEALTARCTTPNISGVWFNVVEDGDVVKLVLQTTDPHLDPVNPNVGYWTNAAGGDWMTAANWEDGNVADTYDMQAVFATESSAVPATVNLPAAADVEVETLSVEKPSYRVANGSLKPMRVEVDKTGVLEVAGGSHTVDGDIYLGGGVETAENKLTVSGGSLTCDNLYMKYATSGANAESSTLEISGGVVTAKTSVVVAYHAGTGTNKVTMTGGKLVTPSLMIGGGAKTTRENTTEVSFSNCEIDLGTGTFDRDSSGECPKTCLFGNDAVIRAGRIVADDTVFTCQLTFDGATFRPTKATSDRKTSGIDASYLFTGMLGSKGLVIDTTEVCPADGVIQDYVPVYYIVRGATLTVTGGGCVYFDGYGHPFHSGTIVSSNASTVIVSSTPAQATAGQCSPIVIEPGSAFRFLNSTMEYKKSVTLGRTGATEPARLEFNNTSGFAATAHQFSANPLVVNSPVSVAWCADGWRGAATCPDGVYTGIVYTAKNSVVDTSNFVLPTYYQSWKSLSTEIIDWSETQKALVFTVTTTGEEPEPPAPEPTVIDTLVVPTGDQQVLADGTTVKNLTLGAGSWNVPSVIGSFVVSQVLSLGLLPGEIASAKVQGDVTIKAGCVWKVDAADNLLDYDLLVVDGKLTVERGAILDFGRTEAKKVPRNFRVPIATATGTISVPERVTVLGLGWEYGKADLTVEGGVLYASRVKQGLTVIVR